MNIGAHVAIQAATQAAAQAAAVRSRILTRLEDAGAQSRSTSIELDLTDQGERDTMAALVESGQVRIAGANRFYLGESPMPVKHRRILLWTCMILLAVLLLLAFVMLRQR